MNNQSDCSYTLNRTYIINQQHMYTQKEQYNATSLPRAGTQSGKGHWQHVTFTTMKKIDFDEKCDVKYFHKNSVIVNFSWLFTTATI